jgi:hypothetical protein
VNAGAPKFSLARSLIGIAATLALHTFVSGCALNGDFDRVRPGLVSDDMHKWVGKEAARSQGIQPSHYPLTDDERMLRDLAYPLIEPPYERNRWFSVLNEYGLNRSTVPEMTTANVNAYAEQLTGTAYRSATARYMKVNDDIQADITRIDPFFMLARRVVDMDDKRKKSLAFVNSLPEGEGEARARMAENALVVAWVQQSLAQRAASYRVALERLVIQTPAPMAVEVERGIAMLKQQIAASQVVPNVRFPKRRPDGEKVALAGQQDLNGN